MRVLCNVVPNERWMGTMLHEFGHAIYDLSIDRELPWVLRKPPHTSSTEAIAMLFGRLSKDPTWLGPVLGLPAPEAKDVAAAAAAAFSEGMLVFTRWVLVMSRFERALYRDPEQDLDALWWDLVERTQGVRKPAGRKAPDWAAKIHLAVAPVYYHAYLMGECIASQLVSPRARRHEGRPRRQPRGGGLPARPLLRARAPRPPGTATWPRRRASRSTPATSSRTWASRRRP